MTQKLVYMHRSMAQLPFCDFSSDYFVNFGLSSRLIRLFAILIEAGRSYLLANSRVFQSRSDQHRSTDYRLVDNSTSQSVQ